MAKDLSDTNIFAQKEADTYRPAFLVELVRDHPELGESTLYYTTWSKSYAIGGNTYLDRLKSLGDLRLTITPGGGVAVVSDWLFSLTNPKGHNLGLLSDMDQYYFLENDQVLLKLVFRTGSEVSGDIITLFDGHIQDTPSDTGTLELFAKDGTSTTLKAVPQEVADFVRFPNMPLNNINRPIYWPFGSLDTEPFNTSGSRPRLAPCICTDKFSQQYSPGLLCKTYGQPYVYYRSALFWGRAESYTQSGAFFTTDSSSRFSKIKPIRALVSNDVTTWTAAVDGSTSTGATIENGDNLDLQFRGSPKLGTITDIDVVIVATGGFDYIITKSGEANVAGSGSGTTTIDLDAAGWDFSNDWDFEQIKVYIDGTGDATIHLVTLDVTFDEQETGDQMAFPVFQAVSGYQDVAAQYQDGSVINGANALLENPVDVVLALMRDKRTGMRMEVAEIDTTNIAAERAKIADWEFAFSLNRSTDQDELSALCEQGKIRLFRNFDGKWKVSIFDKEDAPAALFSHYTNIAVKNPESEDPKSRVSSFRKYQSPMSEILNEWQVSYGWDEALAEYTEVKIASPHYLLTGTGTVDDEAGTFTDGTATFITDGVQANYKLFVIRDVLYNIDSVDSETVLSISTVDAADTLSDRTDTYYIGPNFNYKCFRSTQKYKVVQRRVLESRYIQDDDTAGELIDHLVEYWADRRLMVSFKTWLNAVDVELGDFIFVEHDDLPPHKRPVQMGTLNGVCTKTGTELDMDGTGALLMRIDDWLVLMPADGSNYREVMQVTDVDEDTGAVTVTRGQAGTGQRAWVAGDKVYRAITKFEVVEIKLLPEGYEFEIVARETPRHYMPIGHAAPDGTPDYDTATAEQQAQSGWASYPNGEASWLDETSAVSYARDA